MTETTFVVPWRNACIIGLALKAGISNVLKSTVSIIGVSGFSETPYMSLQEPRDLRTQTDPAEWSRLSFSKEERRVVAFLVQGTWAGRADWLENSLLARRLGEVNVLTVPFRWSGRNRHRSRVTAADELYRAVVRLSETGAAEAIFLIGHSHGGTVSMMASNKVFAGPYRCNVVCLSTPFICLRDAKFDDVKNSLAGALWCFPAWIGVLLAYEGATMAKCVLGALGVAIFVVLLFTRWASVEAIGSLRLQTEFPATEPNTVLILRTKGDEASVSISTMQFGALLIRFLSNLTEVLAASLVSTVFALFCFALSLMISGVRLHNALSLSGIGSFLAQQFSPLAPQYNRSVMFWISFTLLLLCAAKTTLDVCVNWWEYIRPVLRFVGGALLGPVQAALLVVRSIPMLAFGPEFVLAQLRTEVSVEATPEGKWTITAVDDPMATRRGLMHSSLYESPATCELVIRAIKNRLDQPDFFPKSCCHREE